MAQIVIADIEAYDANIGGIRTLRYATQGYTVGASPTGDPTLPSNLTLLRSSTATRFNRNGLMEIVANNVPRFDYDPATLSLRGLLVEGARTNAIWFSEAFTNAVYYGGPADVTVVDNAAVSLTGALTASTFTEGYASAVHARFQLPGAIIATQTYSATLFVKKTAGARGFALGFGASTSAATLSSANRGFARWDTLAAGAPTATGSSGTGSVVSATAADMGNGWFRLLLTFVFDTGNTNLSFAIGFGITNSDLATASTGDGSSYVVYGLQLEAGNVPTSYIPTTNGTVLRQADEVTIPDSAGTAGTIYAQFMLYSEAQTRVVCSLDNGTASQVYQLRVLNGVPRFAVTNGGVDQADITLGTVVPFTKYRMAAAYAANDFAASINGGAVGTDSAGTLPTIDRLRIGGAPPGTQYINGWVQRITRWPTRLTNAQLQAISSGTEVANGASLDLALTGNVNAHYEGRIQQPANVQRMMFSDLKTLGPSQIGFGNLVLTNMDGGLDNLLDYSFAGRGITIRLGELLQNSSGIPTWITVIKGVMEQAELSWQKVTIRVRDRQQDLAKPLQQVRYAGNNSLPNGLEGVATDIAGKPKPLVFGQVFNAPLTLVNSSRLIYQAHDGSALQSVDAVYDRGNSLTIGAAYASQVDMETSAPGANQARVWNSAAGTYIRLGSNPAGTVTADLTQGAAAANRTAAQLWSAILNKAGVSSADISSADVTALDAAVAYPVGVFCGTDTDMTALQACDIVCGSVGAYFGSDALGVFRIGRLELPIGTEVGTITKTDVISIDRVASRDPGVGLPAWKIKLGYQRIWYVQDDTTANVNTARKGYLAQEYRRAEASDATVKTANLTSPEIEVFTTLVNQADAANEAARRLTLYKSRRDMLQVRVRAEPALAAVLDLNKIVTLQLPRYNLGAGKKFLIIGLRTDMRGRLFDLTLWAGQDSKLLMEDGFNLLQEDSGLLFLE